jgi:hypothetical protein
MPFRKDIVQATAQSLFDAGAIALAVVLAWKHTHSALATMLASALATGAVRAIDRKRSKWTKDSLLPVRMRYPGSTAV